MRTSEGLVAALRGACLGTLLHFSVATTPSPSCRPRVGKFGTYYAKGYAEHLQDCTKQLAEQRPVVTLPGDLGAIVEVVIKRPKTTTRVRPNGDVDNYAKATLDGATKAGLWDDDGQVIALFVLKRWAEPGENPGINLTVGSLKDDKQSPG